MSSHATTVNCLGDSITAGYWQEASIMWPARMQAALGSTFNVTAFAKAGTCAMKGSDAPFWDTQEAEEAKANPAAITLIMLGTNDAKEGNWKSDEAFVSELTALINEHKGTQRTIVMTPPPAHGEGISGLSVINGSLHKLVRKAVQNVEECELCDVRGAFSSASRGPTDFLDGVHPNEYGQALIARAAAAVITNNPRVAARPIPSFMIGGGGEDNKGTIDGADGSMCVVS